MIKDFTPKMWWIINNSEESRDLCLNNIRYSFGGKTWNMYTDEELEDRKKHRYLAVTGADVYKKIRENLSDEAFESFHRLLGELIEADDKGKNLSGFPQEMKDWYFNRHEHYYHEPNDKELLEYVLDNFAGAKEKGA